MDPSDLLTDIFHLMAAYGAGLEPEPGILARLKHIQLQAVLAQSGCHEPTDVARLLVEGLGKLYAVKGESSRSFERRSRVNRSAANDLFTHPAPNPKLPTLVKLAVALNYPLVERIQKILQPLQTPVASKAVTPPAVPSEVDLPKSAVTHTSQPTSPVRTPEPEMSEGDFFGDYYVSNLTERAYLGFYELAERAVESVVHPKTADPVVVKATSEPNDSKLRPIPDVPGSTVKDHRVHEPDAPACLQTPPSQATSRDVYLPGMSQATPGTQAVPEVQETQKYANIGLARDWESRPRKVDSYHPNQRVNLLSRSNWGSFIDPDDDEDEAFLDRELDEDDAREPLVASMDDDDEAPEDDTGWDDDPGLGDDPVVLCTTCGLCQDDTVDDFGAMNELDEEDEPSEYEEADVEVFDANESQDETEDDAPSEYEGADFESVEANEYQEEGSDETEDDEPSEYEGPDFEALGASEYQEDDFRTDEFVEDDFEVPDTEGMEEDVDEDPFIAEESNFESEAPSPEDGDDDDESGQYYDAASGHVEDDFAGEPEPEPEHEHEHERDAGKHQYQQSRQSSGFTGDASRGRRARESVTVDAQPVDRIPESRIDQHRPKVAVKATGVAVGVSVGLCVTDRGCYYTAAAGVLMSLAAAYSRNSHTRDFMLYAGCSATVTSLSKAAYEYHQKKKSE